MQMATILMKRYPFLLLVMLGTIAFSGCNGDDDDAVRTIIISGDPEGADFYSDLPEPDTMLFTNIHVTTREFDINNDGVMDVTFIAERDTIVDGGTPVRAVRKLSIRATDEENNVQVFVSTLNGQVRAYGRGMVINRNNAIWTTLREEMPLVLAGLDQSLTSGQTDESGNWNALMEHCIGFLMPSNPEVMTWFEIDVLSADSWVYHDHAAFTLE